MPWWERLWRGWTGAAQGPQCRQCSRPCSLDELVFVNHCYHEEKSHYRHRHCAGMRLLCRECHLATGTLAYYESALHTRAREQPDQYPWDDCLIGLRLYLQRLDALVASGVDPSSEEEIALAW